MTVATNALLEGDGARTALLATEGFTDVVELGRQARAELYRLCAAQPGPAGAARAPRRRRRADAPDGVLERPLTDAALDAAVDGWPRHEPEAVAVVPAAQLRAPRARARAGRGAARAAARRARLAVARGRRHLPRVRARGDHRGRRRAVAPAAPLPAGAGATAPREAGLPEPEIMQSSGGLAPLAHAAAHAALTVLSGPAGGAAAAALIAARERRRRPAVLRHGRHLLRRLRRRGRRRARDGRPRGRRPPAGAADGRHPHRRAPAAARSPGATRAARCGSARASAGAEPGPGLPTAAAAASRR